MISDTKDKPILLLVDDHPNNIVALEAVLGTHRYHILTANSGEEALRLLDVHEVALVILDVQMPGMDGYEVSRRIKACARLKHIPIILVTAIFCEDPHIQRGYEAGAIDYFAKPFNPDRLRAKVEIYAELYRKRAIVRRNEREKELLELRYQTLHQTLEQKNQELAKQAENRDAELATVLEGLCDPVYVVEESGVTRCNSAALSMFGLAPSETRHLPGSFAQRLHIRYPENEAIVPESELPYQHALRGREKTAQLKIRHGASGADVLIECAARPVISQGDIIGAVIFNVELSNGSARRGL